MAAPLKARAPLFAVFAFNLEVARAPWVSAEPAIGEMRLQWWRETLDEIAQGKAVRQHEVATALANTIEPEEAILLAGLVEARRRDIYSDPFADAKDLMDYLLRTNGTLMWVAARTIGCVSGEKPIRIYGQSSGLANWFLALPDLVARGRQPLPDASAPAIEALAFEGLQQIRQVSRDIPSQARPATRSGWQAGRILASAAANPTAVTNGSLHNSEFSKRISLIWRVVSGAP